MIELQVISRIIERKDFSIVRLNNIDRTYFPKYQQEFDFIEEHYNKYSTVCDLATFLSKFPNISLVEVTETDTYLVEKLREEWLYNKSVPILQHAAKLFTDVGSTEAVEYLNSMLPALSSQTSIHAVDLVEQADIRYDKYIEKSLNADKYYIGTGFPELDRIIGGWDKEEDLITVVARTNQGKSWFLDYFLLNALKLGYKVGLYSGEMSANSVGYRLDTFMSNISNYQITRGNVDIKERYKEHIEKFKKLSGNFYIITPKELGGYATPSKLRSFCEKYGIEILGIDQYSLMDDDANHNVRHERFESISKDLKLLQEQLQIPIITVSQMGRGEKGIEQDLTDIAGSDRIAQDSTKILNIQQKDDNVVLTIMKSRDAKVGSKLIYHWKIDTGEFMYVPCEEDALDGKECKAVEEKFTTEGDNPF